MSDDEGKMALSVVKRYLLTFLMQNRRNVNLSINLAPAQELQNNPLTRKVKSFGKRGGARHVVPQEHEAVKVKARKREDTLKVIWPACL